MTAPNEPTQNQPAIGQPPIPPSVQLPLAPAGQYPPPLSGQYPPSPVAKKRAPWLLPTLIGVGAFVVLCCGGTLALSLTSDDKKTDSAAVSTDTSADAGGALAPSATGPAGNPAAATTAAPEPVTTTAAPQPAEPKSAGVGDKVRGGDFEFTVKSVKCGITQVGNEFLNKKAQGAFCKVSVTVKNVTKKAHTFHADGSISA